MTLSPAIASLFDLEGKSALVVGGSGAFGGAAAQALSGAGAHVTVAGANKKALEKVAGALDGDASIAIGRPDSEATADALVAAACANDRHIDIMVAASGTSVVKPSLDMSPEEFDRVQDANVRQQWLIARAAGRAMIEQERGGRLIFVSSVRARFAAAAGTSTYAPSKAAVNMLTRSFAVEWGRYGITANAIAPTVFRSELTAWMYRDDAAERQKRLLSRIPLGRRAEPEDFAGAIVFLSAAAGGYVTGEILHVDGGFSAN